MTLRNHQPDRPKIALASSGLFHVRRGYETVMLDTCIHLKGRVNVALLAGTPDATYADTEVIHVPTIPRNHPLMSYLFPAGETQRYRYEQFSMALSGFLAGLWQQYDIIHFSDPGLGGALLKLRGWFRLKYRLLFANGGPMNPSDYQRFDHIQEYTPANRDRGLAEGIAAGQSTLIPIGVNPVDFQPDRPKADLRREWDLPPDGFIVLSVASPDEPYKRIPSIIENLAACGEPGLFLLLAGHNRGSAYAQETLALAEEKLPGRYRQLSVPYARIGELYGASDLFVLASLNEGFGKVYLEAMAAGLPVLCHDNANTRWIVASEASRIDMENREALISAIRRLKVSEAARRSMVDANRAGLDQRFTWEVLADQYLSMYHRALAGGAADG